MPAHERVGDLSPYMLKKLWDESEPERSPELFDVWEVKRRQSQSDLFWLCGLLGYAVTEKAHRDICEKFFLKKNPDIPLDDLSGEKQDRLLFAPRDAYKSSIANADDVQWVICYPNVKLAIQSSKTDRAAAFTDEIKNFFLAPEDKEGILALTRFQVLFPEHVLPERSRGASGSYTTPARKQYSKEPTIDSLGIDESKASGHYHVGRNDDVISESNSGYDSTPEARAIVGKKLIESRNLFDTILYLGTPQNQDDGYTMLQENLKDSLFVMVKSAWEVKKESQAKAEAELTGADYNLFFEFDARGKKKLAYLVLRSAQRANPDSFHTQQLCKSSLQKKKIEITSGLINAHVLPVSQLDNFLLNTSPVISAWDLSYSTGERADWCVGTAGSRDDIRKAVVRDIQRGKYLKADLIRAMVVQAIQFRVNTMFIEGTNGTGWLYEDIVSALQQAGARTTRVEFIQDRQFSIKELRYAAIHSALENNELWFAVNSAQVEIIHELTSKKRTKFDDVSDSIGHFLSKVSEPLDTTPQEAPASLAQTILVEKRLRDAVYGTSEREWKGTEPEPAYGYRVEELKPEEPPKEWDGAPVYKNTDEWLYAER
jgi:hypothetical protein